MSGSAIMRMLIAGSISIAFLLSAPAEAGQIEGPARFCGYSPIIDLLPGEKVTTLESGIHGGSFRWEGIFGSLDVHGIGWASRPKGRMIRPPSTQPAIFAQRRIMGRYKIAIWNGTHGAAYFRSATPFTALQLEAINRVDLFEEGQIPSNCDLRTVFSWE